MILPMGLNYIHEHHFLHRDIKAENILLNGKMQAKIADFGGVIAFENKNLAVIDSYLVGTSFLLLTGNGSIIAK